MALVFGIGKIQDLKQTSRMLAPWPPTAGHWIRYVSLFFITVDNTRVALFPCVFAFILFLI